MIKDALYYAHLEHLFQNMAADLGPQPRFTDEEKRAIKKAIDRGVDLGFASAQSSCPLASRCPMRPSGKDVPT